MTEEFNQFPWHDAVLLKIVIDRSQEENVRIFVRWPEDAETMSTCIEFKDCYALQANMNYGMVPPDSIMHAECILDSLEIDTIKKTWGEMGFDLSGLRCYYINTNSTNSVIKAFALG